jgi:uncharacterized protein YcbX
VSVALHVSALFVYPVKSCRGIPLERAAIDDCGLRHDRRWLVVDADGAFLTQRTHPRLTLVETGIEREALVLSSAGRGSVSVPLSGGGQRRRVRIWKDEVEAIPADADASRWLGSLLDADVSLVRMPADVVRPVSPAYGRPGDSVSFADALPLLVATEASLGDLNARLARPLPMDRFRPNIVVRGGDPWTEDVWRRVRVADVPVRLVKGCDRCVVTTTDQRTGERGVEPLRTLATFRNRDGKVYFGVNGVPDARGVVAVGDAITVLE